jgi:excisionase family DNA binding protein
MAQKQTKRITLAELADQDTVDVPIAGSVLGVSRDSAYEAARRGEIPVLRFGRRIVVPVAALRKMLSDGEDKS